MITNRLKTELNKKEYYEVNPKTGSQKRININKLLDNAKKALKRAVLIGLALGTIGTGVLSYIFAGEIADFTTFSFHLTFLHILYEEFPLNIYQYLLLFHKEHQNIYPFHK